jgi:hypothetical protein
LNFFDDRGWRGWRNDDFLNDGRRHRYFQELQALSSRARDYQPEDQQMQHEDKPDANNTA